MFKEVINAMNNEEIVELIQAQESMIAHDNDLIFNEEWQIKKLAEILTEVAGLLRGIRDHERQRLSLFEQTERICRNYEDKMPHVTWPCNSEGRVMDEPNIKGD